MKKIKLYITAFFAVALLSVGCDKGFDEVNIDKINMISLDPAYVLNSSVINVTERGARNYLGQAHTIIQWLVCPFGTSMVGANYNQWTTFQDDPWNSFYNSAVQRIVDVIYMTKDDPSKSNLYSAARIWKAHIFQILTDTYGDVPYKEAGLGFYEQIMYPNFDTQEDIYKDLLKELDEASAALDPAKGAIAGEIFYGGDVAKWKKFGYSMLLRTAMRLSKIDPATAQTYVTKAIAGGLMESNDDNAWIRHTPEFTNRLGAEISGTERGNYYITEYFVNFMKSTNDPRLGPLTHRYPGAMNAPGQTNAIRTKDPALQIGQPIGYDPLTIPQIFSEYGVVAIHDFSQIDWNIFFVNTSPEHHCTYGQTQLLLAEAIVRGWATGDAADAFAKAVRANMNLYASFGSAATVPTADIDAYIAANPLDMSTTAAALKQINEEYWVGSFPNGAEGWANWRRSGYPDLPVNTYPGSQIPGEFIRRHRYPQSESNYNVESFRQAVNRSLGGVDRMNARVWWDKE